MHMIPEHTEIEKGEMDVAEKIVGIVNELTFFSMFGGPMTHIRYGQMVSELHAVDESAFTYLPAKDVISNIRSTFSDVLAQNIDGALSAIFSREDHLCIGGQCF